LKSDIDKQIVNTIHLNLRTKILRTKILPSYTVQMCVLSALHVQK